MAKTVIKFSAVPYQVGTGSQTRTGYRPQLEAQAGVFDLPFCREVVNEKRLQTSPDELLHDVEMVAEVASAKVAEDGRPRGITKFIKWNRFAKGNLESPTSPWNETCKAEIRPQLLADATKIVDATFQNVNDGIGVRLNYVAWVGAQTVTNVVKVGKSFAAYGNHMEFIAGDTATLTVGETAYPLVCTESDVAHAVFGWPTGLAPEAGTEATFVMLSRGGIEEGEVYTSKKVVTIIAGDAPTLKRITLSDFVPDRVNGTTSIVCQHPEGATGYVVEGGAEKFTASFSQGSATGSATFARGAGTTGYFASEWPSGISTEGGAITCTVTPNPAKTDFDQTPVSIVEA